MKEHKQTTAAVIVKLVKKVKKLETRVKYGNLPSRKMVLCDSESEDAANSSKEGRNLGEEDVASQKIKTYTRRVKSGLKKKLDVGVSSGDRKFKSASEEIKSGFTNISFWLKTKSRPKKRKGSNLREQTTAQNRSEGIELETKEGISLAEIARIQAQEAAKIEKKRAELEI
ncbi:hypothetical protein Tco_0840379 [Tanacetum coccineum]|uniref:Uncharacterized protein n=1 Tax=Tanacetum coccineum TaxID=301880 RepID=A0ABQ5AW18_9ASTR